MTSTAFFGSRLKLNLQFILEKCPYRCLEMLVSWACAKDCDVRLNHVSQAHRRAIDLSSL